MFSWKVTSYYQYSGTNIRKYLFQIPLVSAGIVDGKLDYLCEILSLMFAQALKCWISENLLVTVA